MDTDVSTLKWIKTPSRIYSNRGPLSRAPVSTGGTKNPPGRSSTPSRASFSLTLPPKCNYDNIVHFVSFLPSLSPKCMYDSSFRSLFLSSFFTPGRAGTHVFRCYNIYVFFSTIFLHLFFSVLLYHFD
jgi:hypothetical protein